MALSLLLALTACGGSAAVSASPAASSSSAASSPAAAASKPAASGASAAAAGSASASGATTSASPASASGAAASGSASASAAASSSAGSAAASGAALNGQAFIIGAVEPLSGIYGQIGQEDVQGLKAGIDEVNAAGGIMGGKVTLVTRDSQSDPAKGVAAMKDLLANEHPNFVIPDTISSIAQSLVPLTDQAKIITMSAASATPLANPQNFPYYFQMVLASDLQIPGWAAGLKNLGVTKVGILSADDAAGQALVASMKTNFPKLGLQIVDTEFFSPGSKDDTVQVQKLKNAGAQGIALQALVADNRTAMTAIQNLAWKDVKVVGSVSNISSNLQTDIPSAVADQFYAVVPRLVMRQGDTVDPQYQQLITDLKKYGPITSLLVSTTFRDIVHMEAWAVNKTGSNDGEKVKATLENLGSVQLPEGTLLEFPNPRYSSSTHSLANADLTNYWGLIHTSQNVDGTYLGKPISLSS